MFHFRKWPILLAIAFSLSADVNAAESPRIVSLSPAITALFYETGAGDHLVGVTRYCRVPAGVKSEPTRVGGALDPELERLLACSPDRVLAGTLLPARTVQQLKRLGLEVQLWRQDELEDIRKQAILIGRLTGMEAEARARVNQLKAALDNTAPLEDDSDPESESESEKPTALMVFSSNIQTVAGPGTYGHEVLANAGLENAASGLGLKWPSVSREWLLAADPDWIIAATHRTASEADAFKSACLERWGRDSLLGNLNAVKAGRVIVVADNRLGIPSLALLEVIPYLREAVASSVVQPGGAE